MRKHTVPTIISILLLVLAGITSSQATSQVSKVYACVNKASGELRIVSAGKKCTKKDNKINWVTGGSTTPEPAVKGVYLRPSDFISLYEDAGNETRYFNGYPKQVWVLQESQQFWSTIQTTVMVPSEWSSVTEVLITLYWTADQTDGNVVLYIGEQQYAENDELFTTGTTAPQYSSTPNNEDTVLKTTHSVSLASDSELMEISIERYLGNDGDWIDTNSGDISILGLKIEPVS